MVIASNKVSLNFDDTDSMNRMGVSVPTAREGDMSRIQQGVTMDCTVHKDAGKETIGYTEAEAKQLNINGEQWIDDSQMSPADFISQCMTGEDAEALSGDATPLEEYTSSQLERTLTRVKEQRRDKQDAVENQVEKEQEKAEAVDEAAVKAVAADGVDPQILSQMMDSDLPVTPENVMRLSHALDMAGEIGSFSEASMKFFIGNDYTITPENISGSNYSIQGEIAAVAETDSEGTASGEDDFTNLENQVYELLEKDGMEPDEDTMETAKWLYDNDLPVTADNVRTYEDIQELKTLESETIAARIIDQMADGVQPEKANLMKYSVAEAITARRQLEETRLTMSIEAVRNMSAKGIDLDLTNLEHIVSDLREQERQAKEALLEETGLPVTEENTSRMSDTLEAARSVLAAPIEFLGYAIDAENTDTLSGIATEAQSFAADFVRMEESYDAVGTQVRSDLGDSMKKAFGNVDDILADLGMETTTANERAVRSLAYNQMALTGENVLRMKEYDQRVTTLMEDLKPQVVSELIRRDINPLSVSLDELSQDVKDIQDEMEVEDISFSKYLWKLDHQNSISQEERESMIGIYRLLDKIEKSDGAAAGQVMKEGRELSLSSLLSAVRTRRDAGLDVEVDDDFGGLEKVVANGVSISSQIETAYNTSLARQLRKNLSPTVLQSVLEEGGDPTLEQLLEASEQGGGEEESAYYQEAAQQLRATMAQGEKQILDFLAALDLPDTAANLQMMQAYMQTGTKLWTKLWKQEESEEVLEHFDEPEELEEWFEEWDESHKKELANTDESDDINYEGLQERFRMSRSIAFYGRLREYQTYEIPVFTEQGVTTCNITIRDGAEAEKGSVEITMDSEEFGKLQASFKVNGNRVKSFVTVEEKDSLPVCRQRLVDFVKDLGEQGYTMEGAVPVEGSRTSLHVGHRAEGAKNQDLYRIAKTFIISMNRKDEEE